jgi:peptidoglycan/LPS O-acetylase OafA/YrhL
MDVPDNNLPSLLVTGEGPRTASGALKLPYIDCLRGYAILLVIMCHTAYAVPGLPYPVHLVATAGWFGVQLFFLASCLTLMMSASNEREKYGRLNFWSFFLRRFLRIAPMYYAAAAFYFFSIPPTAPTLLQLAASLTFMNSWHPVTITTVPGVWQVVPGGWSIGVEFTFYFLFPVFISVVTTARRALILFGVTILIAARLNTALLGPLTRAYGFTAADNFLYFWFFNQAPIFALGAVTFFVLKAMHQGHYKSLTRFAHRNSGSLAVLAVALFIGIAWAPHSFLHQLQVCPILPQYLAVAVSFIPFIIAVSQTKSKILVNKLIGEIGTVSFSAYLLHFAVIALVLERLPSAFHLRATGWSAIAVFGMCFLFIAGVTYLCSAITYRVIEAPMMRLAKFLTREKWARTIQQLG